MTLYDKVKAKADEIGKTIAAIEAEAGVANGTISGWRTGKPFAETLAKVARVLGMSVDSLLETEDK